MPPKAKPIAERFWPKVNKTASCWLWAAARNRDGYGSLGGVLAHRVSWEVARGPVPDGALVLHRCDNRPCVNPDHLFLGTQADNMKDCVAKGRQARTRGETSPRAKLTNEAVRHIRHLVQCGESMARIARAYGVDPSAVSRAVSGKRWGHVR
jgi:hypothetical protein